MGKVTATKLRMPKDTSVLSAYVDNTGKTLVVNTTNGEIKLVTNTLIEDPSMYYNSRKILAQIPTFADDKSRSKVEKRFTMPRELFEAIDFTEMGIQEVEDNYDSMPKFIIGEKYALRTPGCDGFAGSEKVYELVGIDDEFGGVKIDAVIVKQISGEVGNIYTLSKNDCNYLGIEYENGLQLFPKKLSWVHVKDVVDFDAHNLATTPASDVDNTIRHIVLKLNGFSDYSDGYVLSPSGKLIKEEQFEKSIMVESNEPIVYGNGFVIQDHVKLNANIIHPNVCTFNHGNFISSEDEVFIHINLRGYDNSYGSYDHCYGVDPKYLDGVDPNEFFTITWDELGGVTVEEYEEAKRKRAEEEAERARKEEEERKRQIEDAAKAKAERKRLEDLAVERMKKFKIKEPVAAAIPTFNKSIDPLVGISMYIDDLDNYFQIVDKTLNDVRDDLLDSPFGFSRRGDNIFKYLEER